MSLLPKRLTSRLDAWAERSRLNPYRLLVMPHPPLTTADRSAFDGLLFRTPAGGDVAYELPQPKWWFLLPRRAPDSFCTARTSAYALFASDDAIWPLYFATVRRAALRHGHVNWAVHVGESSRYVFSIGADPADPGSWSDGTIYLLPAGSFRRTGSSRELVSEAPVEPRARLAVTPEDFPFRGQTIEHGAGDTPARVVFRHAVRRVFR
ncbi:MAG TPA: hypothetical protein VKB70_02970 [Gaiellaceae bacterium]|nr:hypothetical protein [Gaiellaceae bacterium]